MDSKNSEDFGDGIPPTNPLSKRRKVSQSLEELSDELNRKRRQEGYSFRKFYIQSKRKETFSNWKFSEVDIDSLADAGFCYIGIDDACICPWCEHIVSGWNKDDNPVIRHDKISNGLCKYLNFTFPSSSSCEYRQVPVDFSTYGKLIIDESSSL